jgi:hypothetical protein
MRTTTPCVAAVLAALCCTMSSAQEHVRVTHVATREVEGPRLRVETGRGRAGRRRRGAVSETATDSESATEAAESESESGSTPSAAMTLLGDSSATGDAAATTTAAHWETRSAPVPLGSVAVGFAGQVFGVGRADAAPYQFDARTGKWAAFTGGAAAIKVSQLELSCDSTLHALDGAGKLFRKAKGSVEGNWEPLAEAASYAQVAVGRDNDMWAIDAAGNPFYYVLGDKKFHAAEAVKLKSVAVACDGAVWAVTTAGELMERVAGEFRKRAADVAAVRARNAVYVLDAPASGSALFRYRSPPSDANESPRKSWHALKIQLAQFSVGPDESLWGVDASGVPHKHTGEDMEKNLNEEEREELQLKQGGTWSELPRSAGTTEVVTGQRGEVYAISADGEVLKYDSLVASGWETIPAPKLVRLAVGCDGLSLWGVTADGKTHRYQGNGQWLRYSEPLEDIEIGADEEQVYGTKVGSHELVRFDRATKRWSIQKLATGSAVQLQSLAVGCSGAVWGVDPSGKLIATAGGEGQGGKWETRGEGIRSVAVGRSVFLLDDRNYLFEYAAPSPGEPEGKQNWKFLHKQLRAVSTNPAGELVGLSMSNTVVRFVPGARASTSSWHTVKDLAPVAAISVGSASHVLAVDPYGTLLSLNPERQFTPVQGVVLETVSLGCDGEAWGTRTGGKLSRLVRDGGAAAGADGAWIFFFFFFFFFCIFFLIFLSSFFFSHF